MAGAGVLGHAGVGAQGKGNMYIGTVYRGFSAGGLLNGWEEFWGSRSQVGEAKEEEAGGRRGRVSEARGWRGGAIAARMPGAGARWRE